MTEEWRVIDGFPRYSVSNTGRCRNEETGYVLKPFPNFEGYASVSIYNENGMRKVALHILIASVFLEDKPGPEYEIGHSDSNRMNAASKNLRWVTKKENSLDRTDTGKPYSKRPFVRKINESDVVDIILFPTGKRHLFELAEKYGVTRECIKAIRMRRTWKHVEIPTVAICV